MSFKNMEQKFNLSLILLLKLKIKIFKISNHRFNYFRHKMNN